MWKLLTSVVAVLVLGGAGVAQTWRTPIKTKIEVSDPRTYAAPEPSAEAKTVMEKQLAEAQAVYDRNPRSADGLIWLGRRTAYLGRFDEAIAIYTRGIKQHRRDARIYRHRGHRYITTRRFNLAIRDLEKAARLVVSKPDEVEPDGQPNARNIPTSTLKSNIWYHLGLVYFLKGDFAKALTAYRECMKFSRNPDMTAATSHWLYMTLRRLQRHTEAQLILSKIGDDWALVIVKSVPPAVAGRCGSVRIRGACCVAPTRYRGWY